MQLRDSAKFEMTMEKFFQTLETSCVSSPGKSSNRDAKISEKQKPPKSRVHSLKGVGANKDLSLSFAVTDSWAILSFSPSSVEKVLQTLEGRQPGLADQSEFQAASSRLKSDGYLFIYCDQKRLFERAYRLAGLMASFANRMTPDLKNHVDLSKLPRSGTVAQHLFPSVYAQGLDRNGTWQSSFGPINLSGLSLGLTGAILSQAEKEVPSH